MVIVPVDQIPKAVETPIDNLIKIYDVCLRMEQVCHDQNGVGLSAVQVGIPWKLFVICADSYSKFDPPEKYGYFVNCDYIGIGDKVLSMEGCLSLRDEAKNLRRFQVERFKKIRLFGKKLIVTKTLSLVDIDVEIDIQQQSIVFQHEIDHHNDILISNIGKEVVVF
jgi:peptide deformylase